MPTARELLEQADALMRRNRARDESPPPVEVVPATVTDVPETVTDVPETVTVAPMTVTDVPPTVTAAPTTVTAVPSAVTAAQAIDNDIPELMDVAPPAQVDDGAPPLRQALARDLETPPSQHYPRLPDAAQEVMLDDIPELTEVVEEIEAPSMFDPAGDFDLGEPSVWMEPGHGEVSILGPWPEPPVSEVGERGSASAGDTQSHVPGYDDDFAGTEEVGVLHVAPELLDADFVDEQPTDSAIVTGVAALVDGAVALDRAVPTSLPEPTVELPVERVATEVTGETIAETIAEIEAPVGDDAAVEPEARALVDAIAETEAPVGDDAAVEPQAGTVVDAIAEAAGNDERWAMLAEDVRMQVLQRIDIFTDTGLQEQLAVRLQPIVDRASAEFVAAINQHVGQLLRAYVAEAIEREIEKWRAGDR